jgi:hypothetical protein
MAPWFDKLSQERVKRALNVLAEAPFFYQADDADLFAFLRKNRAEFERFYRELYGWQLVVDGRGARLIKERHYNEAIPPRQRDVFSLTRRDECIGFLLVLEFHEHLLEERNLSVDDPEPLRFEFGELFRFALVRFRELLGGAAPSEEQVRRILRAVVPHLLRYRFLSELEPEPEDQGLVDRENLIYECLPALWLYDARALEPAARARALGMAVGAAAAEAEGER